MKFSCPYNGRAEPRTMRHRQSYINDARRPDGSSAMLDGRPSEPSPDEAPASARGSELPARAARHPQSRRTRDGDNRYGARLIVAARKTLVVGSLKGEALNTARASI